MVHKGGCIRSTMIVTLHVDFFYGNKQVWDSKGYCFWITSEIYINQSNYRKSITQVVNSHFINRCEFDINYTNSSTSWWGLHFIDFSQGSSFSNKQRFSKHHSAFIIGGLCFTRYSIVMFNNKVVISIVWQYKVTKPNLKSCKWAILGRSNSTIVAFSAGMPFPSWLLFWGFSSFSGFHSTQWMLWNEADKIRLNWGEKDLCPDYFRQLKLSNKDVVDAAAMKSEYFVAVIVLLLLR